ncbi:MAG TPA: hypothetical protein VGK61_04690 [Planctomycetota bacterium]|jgi:hypothetical protein
MSDSDESDIRRGLEADSRATFGDLRRRLETDRPGACEALDEEITALATGSPDPEAERHVAECARCRDRRDARADLWRRFAWPESRARFLGLRPRLFEPRPFRLIRGVAAALLAAAVAGTLTLPHPQTPADGDALRVRLDRMGVSLKELAALGNEHSIRMLKDIGGPEADALLLGLLGRDPRLDPIIARALAGGPTESLLPADLVRDHRPDLLPALVEMARPGSASAIVAALFDSRLAPRAAKALTRLPRDEVESAIAFAGMGATPDEAETLVDREIALEGALVAAGRSNRHGDQCFWRAVTSDGGLDFLMAAAGTAALREEAFAFLTLLPDDLVAAGCRKALRHPALAAGAARVAAKLGDRRLVPELLRAAKNPPPGMESAGFEISSDELITFRSLTFEAVCMQAVAELTEGKRELR